MMAVQASEKRMRDMIITKETDYALRILRVLHLFYEQFALLTCKLNKFIALFVVISSTFFVSIPRISAILAAIHVI